MCSASKQQHCSWFIQAAFKNNRPAQKDLKRKQQRSDGSPPSVALSAPAASCAAQCTPCPGLICWSTSPSIRGCSCQKDAIHQRARHTTTKTSRPHPQIRPQQHTGHHLLTDRPSDRPCKRVGSPPPMRRLHTPEKMHSWAPKVPGSPGLLLGSCGFQEDHFGEGLTRRPGLSSPAPISARDPYKAPSIRPSPHRGLQRGQPGGFHLPCTRAALRPSRPPAARPQAQPTERFPERRRARAAAGPPSGPRGRQAGAAGRALCRRQTFAQNAFQLWRRSLRAPPAGHTDAGGEDRSCLCARSPSPQPAARTSAPLHNGRLPRPGPRRAAPGGPDGTCRSAPRAPCASGKE